MRATIELDQNEIIEVVKTHLRSQGYVVATGAIRIDEWEEDRGGGKMRTCVAVMKLETPIKPASPQGGR